MHKNRDVHDPRALAVILEKAEVELAAMKHPDPYTGTPFSQGYILNLLSLLYSTHCSWWNKMVCVHNGDIAKVEAH